MPRHRGKLGFQPLSAVKFCQVMRPVADFTVPFTYSLSCFESRQLTDTARKHVKGVVGVGRKGRELVYVSVVLFDVTDRRNMDLRM